MYKSIFQKVISKIVECTATISGNLKPKYHTHRKCRFCFETPVVYTHVVAVNSRHSEKLDSVVANYFVAYWPSYVRNLLNYSCAWAHPCGLNLAWLALLLGWFTLSPIQLGGFLGIILNCYKLIRGYDY